MIIRENDNEFIMIRQHDHAIISEKIVTSFQEEFFPEDPFRHSVLYAIKMHDYGWKNFDKEPFWNDEKNAPFSFIDFPNVVKTVLYEHGINEVEKSDPYAGLLCSEHYSKFLSSDTTDASRAFIAREQARQKAIRDKIDINHDLFTVHFELLKLADNLSLFLCLSEPDSRKEDIHYFFKNGIRIPEALRSQLGQRLEPEWLDEHSVSYKPSPLQEAITLSIPQKRVKKESISKYGLIKSYTETEDEFFELRIK